MKKGEKTRENILKCAEKIFSEKGYYETQVSDIVKMAHVAKGTIYQYFKNKEDVFCTLLERYVKEWEKAISLDMKDFMGDKPGIYYARKFLHHRINKTAVYFKDNIDRANIILRIGTGLNEVFESFIRQFEDKILDIIHHDILLGKKQGHIPHDIDTDVAANGILGATFRIGYYYFASKNERFQNLNFEDLVQELSKITTNTLMMNEESRGS